MPHALLVDSDENLIEPLTRITREHGFSSSSARSLREARDMLRRRHPDLLLLDRSLPDGDGLALLSELPPQRQHHAGRVIVMGEPNGHANGEFGGHVRDCIPKPLDLERIHTHLEWIRQDVSSNGASVDASLPADTAFGPLIGQSPVMQQLYSLIDRVAPTDATVLIVGESGTGKELVAQTIHQRSPRRDQRFVALNCGAIPVNLIESELFGHEKGAFTGAAALRRGVFEQASAGTLLLDEITEMPAELQVRLLRVLETGRITRVGGEKEIPTDVRVLAATNRDPHHAVEQGNLREDLLYRLSVFPLNVPPLRQRGHDIALLAHHFLAQFNHRCQCARRLHPKALQQLETHPWPGNVRQLRNAIQRAHIMADRIIHDLAPPASPIGETPRHSNADHSDRPDALSVTVGTSLAEIEKKMILKTLEHFQGDKRKTARTLGVSLKTLYNRLNAYATEPDR